jgi:precorrin-4 methylase
MRERITIGLLTLLTFAGGIWPTPAAAITVGGAVRQPLNLALEDLAKMPSVSVRLNEVTRDRQFHGVFVYRGVPLRFLLELAAVQKEASVFAKPIDLAVVVRSRDGSTTVLSWGEIFYKNQAEVVVAVSATPVMPERAAHSQCGQCHQPAEYQPALDQLHRQILFPKLVVSDDLYTDRSLEDVVSVEVVDLKGQTAAASAPKLFSPSFVVSHGQQKAEAIGDLAAYRHVEVLTKEVGEGRGYHGVKRYGGVPLRDLLSKGGIGQEMDSVILASAPDGYRSLFSYGELFLRPDGERIIVADSLEGNPIDSDGRFILVPPDDLAADRDVKALATVEVVRIRPEPRVYVIGVGPGDTSLITLEAISYMGKTDLFISPQDITTRFAKYIGGKPILFDPFDAYEPTFRQSNPKLSDAEVKEGLAKLEAAHMDQIREALKAGKNVALLDWGDPTIFGGWQAWLGARFRDQIQVVAGMSALNAAGAMQTNDVACNGSIVVTSPQGLMGNEGLIKAAAVRNDTLAIFLGLRQARVFVPVLRKYYPAETPVHVAYQAGYSNSGRLVSTTLNGLVATIEGDPERQLGLIYIGGCMGGGGGQPPRGDGGRQLKAGGKSQ